MFNTQLNKDLAYSPASQKVAVGKTGYEKLICQSSFCIFEKCLHFLICYRERAVLAVAGHLPVRPLRPVLWVVHVAGAGHYGPYGRRTLHLRRPSVGLRRLRLLVCCKEHCGPEQDGGSLPQRLLLGRYFIDPYTK